VAAVVAAPVAANATASQGGGHTPVTVCHNGNTLTVDDNALKAHLAHGDTEGPCQESTPIQAPTEVASPTVPTTDPSTDPYTGRSPNNRHDGYTAAGVARRAEPAHRKRGFHTYIRGSLTWFDAYDQS
jgi:hypothetical protein